MRPIEILRSNIASDFFSDSEFSALFGDGPARYNKIYQMIARGELSRLKKGLYSFEGVYRKDSQSNLFYLANILFGPSYVSLESALSFYGLIPEAVYSVTSVTVKRTKKYTTPLGTFLYSRVPYEAFAEGVEELSLSAENRFLIATKEKALLDKMYLSSGSSDLFDFCLHSLRLENDGLLGLNREKMLKIAELYNLTFKKRVQKLVSRLNQ